MTTDLTPSLPEPKVFVAMPYDKKFNLRNVSVLHHDEDLAKLEESPVAWLRKAIDKRFLIRICTETLPFDLPFVLSVLR